jgi:uncharacterized protein YigE (DUF2233 family)
MLDLNGKTWREFRVMRAVTNSRVKQESTKTVTINGGVYQIQVYSAGIAQGAHLGHIPVRGDKKTDKAEEAE